MSPGDRCLILFRQHRPNILQKSIPQPWRNRTQERSRSRSRAPRHQAEFVPERTRQEISAIPREQLIAGVTRQTDRHVVSGQAGNQDSGDLRRIGERFVIEQRDFGDNRQGVRRALCTSPVWSVPRCPATAAAYSASSWALSWNPMVNVLTGLALWACIRATTWKSRRRRKGTRPTERPPPFADRLHPGAALRDDRPLQDRFRDKAPLIPRSAVSRADQYGFGAG